MYKSVQDFMSYVESRSYGEKEFHQAVDEVVVSLWDFYRTILIIYMQKY